MADTGSRPEAISPPAGTGNAPGLGEAFSLDLNTGQGGYAVALPLPEGIAGFGPTVRLEYHHGGGPSAFGLGWTLPVRTIDLRLDFGVAGVDPSIEPVFVAGDRELVDVGGGEFRARRESDFTRYRRVGDGWEMTDRTGITHLLGTTPAARIADPVHPQRVVTWLIEQSKDTSGNRIDYTWEIEDGTPYLTAIAYAVYTLRLDYEVRPDRCRSGRAGFIRVLGRRCTTVALHVDDAGTDRVVRRWDLSYQQAGFSGASLLASVRLTSVGHGVPDVVRPAQTFGYREPDPASWHAAFVPGAEGGYPPPLTDPRVVLAPLGDGPSVGVLEVDGGRFTYWPARGTAAFDGPRRLTETPLVASLRGGDVALLDVDGDTQVDLLVGGASRRPTGFYRGDGEGSLGEFVAYPRARRGTPLDGSAGTRLGDLDGDGRVDIIRSVGRAHAWWRNNGADGWSEPTLARVSPDGASAGLPDLADDLVRMADMTGDGLPDLVQIRSGAITYWPNLGLGRFGPAVRMTGSPRIPTTGPDSLHLFDVDGDGCADLVSVTAAGVTVWPNRSGAAFGDAVTDPLVPPPIPGTVAPATVTDDAAAGLLWCSRRSGRVSYVRYDLGPTAYQLVAVDNGAGLHSTLEYSTAAAEQRRDRDAGRLWRRPLPFPLVVVTATRETDVVTGQVAESRYRYHDAYYDDRSRTFEGFAEVEKIETGDASRPDGRTVFSYRVGEDRLPGGRPQDAALNRMLRRVETYADDATPHADRPFTIEESEHALTVLDGDPERPRRVLVTVASTTRRIRERTSDERTESCTYTYDEHGNVVHEERRCGGTLGGVAQPEQVVVTDVTYAVDVARNLLDRVARVTRRDGAGTLLIEIHRHYDGDAFTGLPLGEVERGLLTRETRWVLTRADFAAHDGGDPADRGYQEDTDADGRPGVFAPTERNRYDAHGRKTGWRSATGALTSVEYDASGLFRAVQTTPLGPTTSSYDLVTGKATSVTGVDGAVVHLAYDAQGRVTAVALPGDDLDRPTRSYEYDDTALPNVVHVRMRLESGTDATGHTAVYFDGRQRETQRRVEMAAGRFVVSGHVVRNPWGDAAVEYEPTFAASPDYAVPDLVGPGGDPRPCRTTGYDILGRPVRTVDYGGGVSAVDYGPFVIVATDADGTVREDHLDVAQHRVLTIEQGASGPVRTTFEPDPLGRLVAHGDDLGEVQRTIFDGLGNRLRTNHREAGERRIRYDAQSRVVAVADAVGNDVAALFDDVDRITELRVGGTVRETYAYDDAATHGVGRLHTVAYPGGSQTFEYDAQGRRTRHVYAFDGVADPLAFEFGYDAQGRRTSVTYPDGRVVTEELYVNGVPRRVPGFVDEIDYDPRMLLSSITYANGVTTSVESTPGAGRVAHQRTTTAAGGVLDDQSYTYDPMWRLLASDRTGPGPAAHTAYAYDPLHQLTRVTDDVGGPDEQVTDYGYLHGRLLASNGESGLTLGYDDAAHPARASHLTGPGIDLAVPYDANGNLLALPGRTLEFGPKNELERVTLADGTLIDYAYDHSGQRIRKQVRRGADVTDTLFLGALAEVRNGQLAAYVVVGTSRVALVHQGATSWIHTDPLGSTTFYTDHTATRIARIAYRAFGNATVTQGSPWSQVFALHELDTDAGLYYTRRRWYAADLGQFVSPDGVYLLRPERGIDTPAQLSLYTYVGNDPTNNVDPDGGSFWSVLGGIVGVVVGIVVAVLVIAAFASGFGIGLLALAGVIAAVTGGYMLASANQGNWFGDFMKGFLIGFNAGMNATLMTALGGPILGVAVGIIGVLSVFDTIRTNAVYQGILGWSNWLMPMSWFVLALGVVFFVLNFLGALFTLNQVDALKITYIHMDWSTGSIIMKGGWISNLNAYHTAFDMGNFVYVDRQNTAPDDDVPHETGHNLSLGAFGSIVHMVGFVDEFLINGGTAWTERMADSHAGKGTDTTWNH